MIYVQRNQFLPGKVMMRLITYFRGSQTGPRDHLHKNYLGGAWKKQISQLWNRDGSHLQSLWFLMNCKIWEPLDSSPFYTSTVNTSVTHQFKNNHAKKKKKSMEFVIVSGFHLQQLQFWKARDCECYSYIFDYIHTKGLILKNPVYEFQQCLLRVLFI